MGCGSSTQKTLMDSQCVDIVLNVPNSDVAVVDEFCNRYAATFRTSHTKSLNVQIFYIAKGSDASNSGFTKYFLYEEYHDMAEFESHMAKFRTQPIFEEFTNTIVKKYGECVKFPAPEGGNRKGKMVQSFNGLVPTISPLVGETVSAFEVIVDKSEEAMTDDLFRTHQRFIQLTHSLSNKGAFEPKISQYNIYKAAEGSRIAYTVHEVYPGGQAGIDAHLQTADLDWNPHGSLEKLNSLLDSAGGFSILGSAVITHAI